MIIDILLYYYINPELDIFFSSQKQKRGPLRRDPFRTGNRSNTNGDVVHPFNLEARMNDLYMAFFHYKIWLGYIL